jgi:hypothetical protein
VLLNGPMKLKMEGGGWGEGVGKEEGLGETIGMQRKRSISCELQTRL